MVFVKKDFKNNYVFLAICKTGFMSFTNILDSTFKSKTVNHFYKYWIVNNDTIIHKIYYVKHDILNFLNQISNPKYIICVREPKKRLISSYNFCKVNNWTNLDFNEFLDLKIKSNKINFNDDYCKLLEKKNILLLEHIRPQFECLSVLKINLNDLKYIIRTENLNSDISNFLFNEFKIKFEKNVHLNKSKKDKLNIDEYKEKIDSLLSDEIKIYKQLVN